MAVGELNEAERWLLLSLDAESPLPELLLPIVLNEGRVTRQVRPRLDVPEAAAALARLAERGYVEVRLLPHDAPADWEDGREVDADGLRLVLDDPLNWRFPHEMPEGREIYWAATTADGEAAYNRSVEPGH